MYKNILPEKISRLIGESNDHLISKIMKNLNYDNLKVRDLSFKELSNLVEEAFLKIENAKRDPSGPSKLEKWNNGWAENLKLLKDGIDPSQALKPGYYRPGNIIRFGKKWVYSEDTDIEYKLFEIIRSYLFEKFLKEYESIYEFGCGSVHNLYNWSNIDPSKEYYGFDWADPVLEIGKTLSNTSNINTFKYDLFNPSPINKKFEINSKSCAITIGAMEQMGSNFEKFIKVLFDSKFDLVIHVEPIVEFLDDIILTDFVAKLFMTNRNYLNGLKTYLENLKDENKIQLISSQKVELCGMMNLGWNILVWKN